MILTEFADYRASGRPLQARKLRDYDVRLYGAICYHYGSYKKFIESFGINYNELADKRRWTDAEVIEEFRKYEESGRELNAKSLSEYSEALYIQIATRFGSYEEFLTLQGYDYQEITKKRTWSESDVIRALQDRVKNEESLIAGIIADEHFALYRASTTVFGSYRNAIEAAGLNYDECVNDFGECSYYGREFENKLAEMFEALGHTYARHYRGFDAIIPDFYDEATNIIYDAKLSSWTVFNSDTIEKYTPHCSKLVIVYLRGAKIKRNIDGMEMRHVSYYYDELMEKGLTHFIEYFDDLLERINAQPTQKAVS